MNKVRSAQKRVSSKNAKLDPAGFLRVGLRAGLIAVIGIASAATPPTKPQAQRAREQGANVTGVSTSRKGDETVVSVSGEGAMSRVQTWQGPNGEFHVVFPNGKSALPARMPGGVKVQRVGDSVELIVPTKAGASVRVQPRSNSLDLVVEGGMDEGGGAQASVSESSPDEGPGVQATHDRRTGEERRSVEGAGRRSAGADNAAHKKEGAGAAANESAARPNEPGGAEQPSAQAAGSAPNGAAFNAEAVLQTPGIDPRPPGGTAQMNSDAVAEGSEFFFSLTGLLMIVAVAGLGALLYFMRRRRGVIAGDGGEAKMKSQSKEGSKNSVEAQEPKAAEKFELPPFEPYKGDRRKQSMPVALDRRRGTDELGMRYNITSGELTLEGVNDKVERRNEARPSSTSTSSTWTAPPVIFGAYRIDQEVGKLVQGQPHSIEVLASRAADDRRAIETSLVKVLNSSDVSEAARRRVRQALEDYGFMARQSAALLLSVDAYERVSAARVLGQVKSTSSLPFLLEALYDAEGVVRTEAVTSLGALGLPQAIGALIDMARRYPEVPSSLLAPALTACSFEAQEWLWVSPLDGHTSAHEGSAEHFTGDHVRMETTVDAELPEWLEDESLADALERLGSADVEARIAAAQSLAQFPAQRAVEALTAILVSDESSAVRGAAVTSLGAIDHESVFGPVLFALADEAREVRAAAARAYSGVNFDRADAIARLVETADRETLEDLARSCVKSGMVARAIGRLASEDRRHAYEAYSLLSLVVKGGETKPILDAVEGHADVNVRVGAVRLASLTGDPELLRGLRELAARGGLPEGVRDAIQEADEQGAQVR